MILLDTNILLRFAKPIDPAHAVVRAVLHHYLSYGEILCIVPQNIYEFWAVASRPIANNGLGLSIAECETEVNDIVSIFRFVPDSAMVYAEWYTLVRNHGCQGKVSHDARLIAAMKAAGIDTILTFNTGDFVRYAGINVVDPITIAATLP